MDLDVPSMRTEDMPFVPLNRPSPQEDIMMSGITITESQERNMAQAKASRHQRSIQQNPGIQKKLTNIFERPDVEEEEKE